MKNKSLFDAHIHPLLPEPTGLAFQNRLQHPVKAVLFDIYGTLFISASGDIGTLQANGQKARDFEELFKKFSVSLSSEEIFARLKQHIRASHERLEKKGIDFPEIKIDRIWMNILGVSDPEKARMFAREFELIVNPVYPMPHLAATLSCLAEKKLPMGIISNAQFYTPELFEYFLDQNIYQLGFHPDLVYYSYQYNRAKPSSYLFELARNCLKQQGIGADNTVYVGNDMYNDIYAARSAGFPGVLFAGDRRSLRLRKDHVECRNIVPDAVITDLEQLAQLL